MTDFKAGDREVSDSAGGGDEPSWPQWANDLLNLIREYTGPCPEDDYEGVDLPEELRTWFDGYRDELIRTGSLATRQQLSDSAGGGDGYKDAFYEIGDMLNIPAQALPPKYVWENEMRPKLVAALATRQQPAPASEAVARAFLYQTDTEEWLSTRDDDAPKADCDFKVIPLYAHSPQANTATSASSGVEVTQSDWSAADEDLLIELLGLHPTTADLMRRGHAYSDELAMVARHRTTQTAAAVRIRDAAHRALGEWMAWPDAARDGPAKVDDDKVVSWLSGLPRTLATQTAELTAEVERKTRALKIADDAINEMFRYFDGGETRGSYDGKPERNQLRKAGYAVRAALGQPS